MHDHRARLPYPETSATATDLQKSAPAVDGAPPEWTKHLSTEGPLAIPRAHSARSDDLEEGRAAAEFEGAGAERPSFLVIEGRLEPWKLRDEPCPFDGHSAVDIDTGWVRWKATCNSARCSRCSRRVSARTFALARSAMQDLNPKHLRFVTLTLADDDWQDLRQRMKNLARFLRRDRGIAVNWLWVVEKGEKTGMKHVHCVQWGDFIPWQELLTWWGSRVEIKAAKHATDYLGKNIIRYLGKGLDGEKEAIEDHMNLNGGRAAHWTRGFFNGLSRDAYAKQNTLEGLDRLRNELLEDRRIPWVTEGENRPEPQSEKPFARLSPW